LTDEKAERKMPEGKTDNIKFQQRKPGGEKTEQGATNAKRRGKTRVHKTEDPVVDAKVFLD